MKRILLYIAVIWAVVGCQQAIEPVDPMAENGVLAFDAVEITTDADQLLAPSATRAEGEEMADKELDAVKMPHVMTVTISDKVTGEVVEQYANHNLMPSTVVLKAGSYTVTARTANVNGQWPLNGLVGFDQPQYGATQDVTITSGTTTSVALACRQTTAGVTVSYSDLFKDLYPCTVPGESYRVRVFSSYGGDILFIKGESRTAHYVVQTNDMMLFYQVIIDRANKEQTIINTYTGQEVQFDQTAMPAREACTYNLTIKVMDR